MTNETANPKRSYTVTERVLTACRANIKKAQRAALERRFCATRGSRRELDAAHDNLEAAQHVKREDRTYKYCSGFRHGLGVPDLERSLVMAGESREEYHAHLERFAALPAVCHFDTASQQAKLAQACAFVSWRRLRAFRVQSEWAMRMMAYHLNQAIRWRQSGSGEGEASLPSCENTIPNLVISSAAVLSGAARNLALIGEALRNSSSPSAPPFDLAQGGRATSRPRNGRLDESFRNLLGQPFDLTPERFVELGLGLRRGVEGWLSVWRAVTKLNNRFDQLWCTLVTELHEPELLLAPHAVAERAQMRRSPVVANFDLYSAEILGNPLLRPMRLLELLRPRPVQVKPVDEWRCAQVAYEVQSHSEAELRRLAHRQIPKDKELRLRGSLDHRLLCDARKPREARTDPTLADELPATFEEFLALMEAAFGEESGTGGQGSGVKEGRGFSAAATEANYPLTRPSDTLSPDHEGEGSNTKVETTCSLSPEHGGEGRGEGEGMDRPEGPEAPPFAGSVQAAGAAPPNPATPPTLRDLAELLWHAAALPRRRAEEEARSLAEFLTDYAARLASSKPEDASRRQGVAAKILRLFREADDDQLHSAGICRRARLALYDLAVARFGKYEGFEFLKYPGDRMDQLQSEFFEIYFAEVGRILGQEDG